MTLDVDDIEDLMPCRNCGIIFDFSITGTLTTNIYSNPCNYEGKCPVCGTEFEVSTK